MIRFNFIESARPELFRRITEAKIPRRLRSAAFALGAAIAIATAAWGIESYRLADARALRLHYHGQFEESQLAVSRAKGALADVERLARVSRDIAGIQSSGARLASTVADIGDRLPERTWLTALSLDERGADITGKTHDFATLSRTIAGTGARYPTQLLRAAADERGGKRAPVGYELHLGQSQ